MAISPKSLVNLEAHKFKPGQSGNPRGRPRNRIMPLVRQVVSKKRLKEVDGFTESEINFMERTLLTMTQAELQALANEDGTPAYMKGKAIAIVSDMKNGRTATLDQLRDRQYGKAVDRMDIAVRTTGEREMTIEEIDAEIERLEKLDEE